MKAILLDVSELPPPEPMVEILSALKHLEKDCYLKIFHRRVPYPLFAQLDESNWVYQYQIKDGVIIYIYRQEDKLRFTQLKNNNNVGEQP